MQPDIDSDFGSYVMKVDNREAESPIKARGRIARAYLDVDGRYKGLT